MRESVEKKADRKILAKRDRLRQIKCYKINGVNSKK